MTALILLALKSLLVAGAGLSLLRLTRRRSAAERSAVAHLALLTLVLVPVSSFVLPSLALPVPDAFRASGAATPRTAAPFAMPVRAPAPALLAHAVVGSPRAFLPPSTAFRRDWARYAYALPVVALLLVTLLALIRLFALRSRAEVLVEPVWLAALAHAQRRMGFKSGTALLVSDTLPSPVSWGWARPVIVLSREAAASSDEAEAVIAHELAHVISLDWAKLMLARVATALFWFNPLAWMLAREAHQLREEAADDAVLAAAIPGADYAQLLVGVARHESRGLLLGAHGVAPGPGSLKRRVGRVLDVTLARRPAGRSWLVGFGTGMLVMAAPLAALTVVPAAAPGSAPARTQAVGPKPTRGAAFVPAVDERRTLRVAPAAARATAVATIAAFAPAPAADRTSDARNGTSVRPQGESRDPDASSSPDRIHRRYDALDDLIQLRAVGATPDYVDAIEHAAPWLGRLAVHDVIQLKAVGVTPEFVRDLADAGYRDLSPGELVQARAVGMDGAYVRGMVAAGYRGPLGRLVQARSMGLTPADMARQRRFGAAAAATGRAGAAGRAEDAPDPEDGAGPG